MSLEAPRPVAGSERIGRPDGGSGQVPEPEGADESSHRSGRQSAQATSQASSNGAHRQRGAKREHSETRQGNTPIGDGRDYQEAYPGAPARAVDDTDRIGLAQTLRRPVGMRVYLAAAVADQEP